MFSTCRTTEFYEYFYYDYYEYYETENSSYGNYGDYSVDYSDKTSCPESPIDTNEWQDMCHEETENNVDHSTNHTNPHSMAKFHVEKIKGPGVRNGLSVIVDTLQCGWLSSSVFEGIKV